MKRLIFTFLTVPMVYFQGVSQESAQEYCSTSYNSVYNNSDDHTAYITKVVFAGIDNDSYRMSYSDFTDIKSDPLQKGETYELKVLAQDGMELVEENGYSWGEPTDSYITAWIDWNDDGDFSDDGESYRFGRNKHTKNIVVPEDAVSGSYFRMRIAVAEENDPVGPCIENSDDNWQSGEAEDYLVIVGTDNEFKPVNLSATNTTYNGCDLSWNVQFDDKVNTYKIYYRGITDIDEDPNDYVLYGETEDKFVSISGLRPGQTFYFKVASVSDGGTELMSEEYTDFAAIGQASNLKANYLSKDNVEITWNFSSSLEDKIDGYFVRVSPINDELEEQTYFTDSKSLILTDLAVNSQFDISVYANFINEGPAYPYNRLVVDTNDPVPTALTAVVVDGSSIKVNWEMSEPFNISHESNKFYGYNVYLDDQFLAFTEKLSYLITGLEADKTYDIAIKTVYFEGGESAPHSKEFTTLSRTPVNLEVTYESGSEVNINWELKDEVKNDVEGYKVYYGQLGSSFIFGGSFYNLYTTTEEMTATVSGLKPGKAYSIGISTLHGGGQETEMRTVTILALDRPRNLKVVPTSVAGSGFEVTWTQLEHPVVNLTGFKVSYKLQGESDFTPMGIIPADQRSYRFEGLTKESTYKIRISAIYQNVPKEVASTRKVQTDSYCAEPVYTAANVYIKRFELGDLDNQSVLSESGYSNYKDLSTSLESGSVHEFELKRNVFSDDFFGFNYAVKIWIDYNQDGDFDESGELVYSFAGSKSKYTYTGSIHVPANAVAGSTRMRVMLGANKDFMNPCGENLAFGEIEDYTVVIEEDAGARRLEGVEESLTTVENSSLSIYPNPASDVINIGYTGEIKAVSILSIDGSNIEGMRVSGQNNQIDVSALTNGVYFMYIQTAEGNQPVIEKFIKE